MNAVVALSGAPLDQFEPFQVVETTVSVVTSEYTTLQIPLCTTARMYTVSDTMPIAEPANTAELLAMVTGLVNVLFEDFSQRSMVPIYPDKVKSAGAVP